MPIDILFETIYLPSIKKNANIQETFMHTDMVVVTWKLELETWSPIMVQMAYVRDEDVVPIILHTRLLLHKATYIIFLLLKFNQFQKPFCSNQYAC